jgi:hypothetical protein
MTPNSKASPAYGIKGRVQFSRKVSVIWMIGEEKERWHELCEKAANEYDPQKLHELIVEINCLLEERERQLLRQSISGPAYAG